MLIGFLSAAAQIATTVMVSWRVGNPIKYTYMYRNSRKYYSLGETRYGLYKVHFDDDGIIETWTQRTTNMKTEGTIAAQQGKNQESAGNLSLLTSACPIACQNAIKVRIDADERISLISLIFLCSIVISSSVVLLTLGWNILFSKSLFILMGSFILSTIINATSGGYWYYETDVTWNAVIKAQQYPFPKCSYCFYIFLATTGLYAFCFLLLLLADYISKAQQKRAKINRLLAHNRNHAMNPPPMAYPSLMYNHQNGMMQKSSSYANPMIYGKGENVGYSPYMQYPGANMHMNYQNSFLNNSPNMYYSNHQPMTRHFSYSAAEKLSPGFNQNGYSPYDNIYNGNFRNMPSKVDFDMARQYSGMNYTNNPYGSNMNFRF